MLEDHHYVPAYVGVALFLWLLQCVGWGMFGRRSPHAIEEKEDRRFVASLSFMLAAIWPFSLTVALLVAVGQAGIWAIALGRRYHRPPAN
jgi:uncharacterized membrane protein YGL010W